MTPRFVVGVMGGADSPPETLTLAEALGAAVAGAGWVLLNGGRNAGVMGASTKGAAENGGTVIGLLPGRDRRGASPDLTVALPTGLGDARNALNVLGSDIVVALPGGAGTLSEIALARKAGRPIITLGWPPGRPADLEPDARTETVEEAIEAIRGFLAGSGS